MIVTYGLGPSASEIVVYGSMRACHEARKEAGTDAPIWILADGIPVMALPVAFNRVLIVDGQIHRVMAMNTPGTFYEITGRYDKSVPAPELRIDFDTGRVDWKEHNGREIALYDKGSGAVNRVDPPPAA